MKIRHNRRGVQSLSAALLTRAEVCATAAPGSFAWTSRNCGPVPSPAPPPPSYSPSPSPSYAPPPPPPQQIVQSIDYDAEYARRVQNESNARIAAQLIADEQSRIAAEEAAKAVQAQAELDAMRASANASMTAIESGSAALSTFGPATSEPDDSPADGAQSSGALIAIIGTLAIVAAMSYKAR